MKLLQAKAFHHEWQLASFSFRRTRIRYMKAWSDIIRHIPIVNWFYIDLMPCVLFRVRTLRQYVFHEPLYLTKGSHPASGAMDSLICRYIDNGWGTVISIGILTVNVPKLLFELTPSAWCGKYSMSSSSLREGQCQEASYVSLDSSATLQVSLTGK